MQDPEPSVRAPLLGQDRLGAPDSQYDAAFIEVYTPYMVGLVRFLCWQGAPLADAAEIAQETMAQLYRSWPSVRDRPAWVRKVASRRWARRIADDHREQPADRDDLDDLAAQRLITPDQIRVLEQRREVLRLLNTLPSRQRQVLALIYDGYTPTEIAEELQLDPATVRANLYKARRSLSSRLRKEQQ